MGVEDRVGQDIECPSATLAPEPANSIDSKAKFLDGGAFAVPSFVYIHRVEQLSFTSI